MHPAFVHLGGPKPDAKVVNEAIKIKEKQLGRPLTSQEILKTLGEVIEPDASKRLFISSSAPKPGTRFPIRGIHERS